MKTLANVEEWIKSNPSKNEIEKVVNLINRLNNSKLRRVLYEKEQQLRKLTKVEKELKEISISVPPTIVTDIKKLSAEVLEMKKTLPIIKKRVKKEVKPQK